MQNAVRVFSKSILTAMSALALLALQAPAARAQSTQDNPPAAKQKSSKSDTQTKSASTLPTTHVTGEAKAKESKDGAGGGRMLNPYSEQPETKYIRIPVNSTGCKEARAAGRPYFVEFRARGAQSFGHTFVLFGKLGEGSRFASYKIAGLHPKGGSADYTMGLWMPVAAETGPSDGDADEQFLAARYCVTLTEAEYSRLVPYIKQLQSEHKTWHGPTYNCNSFAMDIAKFVGLDAPNPNANLPKELIQRLAELNKGRQRNASGSASSGSNFFSMPSNPFANTTPARR